MRTHADSPAARSCLPALIAASSLALLSTLAGCGADEEPPPETLVEAEAEPEAVPEPEPAPEPEPEPEPVPECPEDRWGVATGGPVQGTESGVEAAGWARAAGRTFEQLRACRTVEGREINLSCAADGPGAQCELATATQNCTATVPLPMLPAVVGQFVDTQEQPEQATWRCTRRR